MYTPLNRADDEEGDFNLLGRVSQVVHRDNYMSDIRITDNTNATWYSTISRKKFPRVKEGELIKIRSVEVDHDTSRHHSLKFTQVSNIMTIVPFSKLHTIHKATGSQEKVDKELLKGEIIHEPVLATTLHKKFQGTEVSSLNKLFNSPA